MLRKSEVYVEDFSYLAEIFTNRKAKIIIDENSIARVLEESSKKVKEFHEEIPFI